MNDIQRLSFFDYVKGKKITWSAIIFRPLRLDDDDVGRMYGVTYHPNGDIAYHNESWHIGCGFDKWKLMEEG